MANRIKNTFCNCYNELKQSYYSTPRKNLISYLIAHKNNHKDGEHHLPQPCIRTISENQRKINGYLKNYHLVSMHTPQKDMPIAFSGRIHNSNYLESHIRTSTYLNPTTQGSMGGYCTYSSHKNALANTILRHNYQQSSQDYLNYKLLVAACAGLFFTAYEIDNLTNTPLTQIGLPLQRLYDFFIRFTKTSLAYMEIVRIYQSSLNSNLHTIKCEQIPKFNSSYDEPTKPKSFTGKLNNISISADQAASNSPIEDRFQITFERINNKEVIIASVIDGHSGFIAAEFICKNIAQYVIKAYKDSYFKFSEGLIHYFNELDKALEKFLVETTSNPSKGGACAITVTIDDEFITVANTGDCMAVLSTQNKVVKMNPVHNANDPIERKKVLESHPNEEDAVYCKHSWAGKKAPTSAYEKTLSAIGMGQTEVFYSGCYVKNALNPTRSFGDFFLKDEKYAYNKKNERYRVSKPFSFPYITAEPEITTFNRSREDEFIIIACDGVWDFFSAEEVAKLVREEIKVSTQAATERVISEVYNRACQESGLTLEKLSSHPRKRRYIDDLTVIVIDLSNKEF